MKYSSNCELGMNGAMLKVFTDKAVRILNDSDAHSPIDVGVYIIGL